MVLPGIITGMIPGGLILLGMVLPGALAGVAAGAVFMPAGVLGTVVTTVLPGAGVAAVIGEVAGAIITITIIITILLLTIIVVAGTEHRVETDRQHTGLLATIPVVVQVAGVVLL